MMQSIRTAGRLLALAAQAIAPLCRDAIGIAGALLICHGVGLIYRPAGFIAAGAFLLLAAYFLSRAD